MHNGSSLYPLFHSLLSRPSLPCWLLAFVSLFLSCLRAFSHGAHIIDIGWWRTQKEVCPTQSSLAEWWTMGHALHIFALFFGCCSVVLLLISMIALQDTSWMMNTRTKRKENQTTQYFTLGSSLCISLSFSWHYHTSRLFIHTHTPPGPSFSYPLTVHPYPTQIRTHTLHSQSQRAYTSRQHESHIGV